MDTGKIIFLNGTSSSGKSSIAKQLQAILLSPYLHVEVDSFLKMLPDNFTETHDNNSAWQVIRKVVSGYHCCLDTLSSAGCNIIADHVLQESAWLQECVTVLEPEQVLFVGVHCSLEELERRELARGDRGIGTARFQRDKVHASRIYDIEVDTTALSARECAQKIVDYLRNPRVPNAFTQLQQTRQ